MHQALAGDRGCAQQPQVRIRARLSDLITVVMNVGVQALHTYQSRSETLCQLPQAGCVAANAYDFLQNPKLAGILL